MPWGLTRFHYSGLEWASRRIGMHVAEFLDAVGVVFAGPGSYSWGLTQDLRPGLSDAAPPGLEPGSAPDDGCTLKIPTSRTEREKWGTRHDRSRALPKTIL
jgi:hypothetical protein